MVWYTQGTLVQNKRRMEVSSSAPGISHNYIDLEFVDDTVVNLHGYRAEVTIEPQDADANANGIVAVWVLPGGVIQNADLPTNYGGFGDEDFAPYLWGFHPWTASNQTPMEWVFAPKSTRNMQKGSRIVLHVFIQGLSGGLARLNTTQTGFTSNVN